MNWNRLIVALGGLWLAWVAGAAAQTAKADHDLFLKMQDKANKGDAQSQLELAELYTTGTVVDMDLKKAAKWHRKAAEQGLAAAEYRLGLDYARGYGVKDNPSEAFKWFQKAAEQGLVDAQIESGRSYANGRGTETSATKAVNWFRKAAAQGSSAGKYELGMHYLQGEGLVRDIEEALRWIQPAAFEGYALAQNQLGQCYERGEGVSKNLVEAYKWFDLAAAQDGDNAADIRLSLAKVETMMTKEQIEEAQRLTLEFRPIAVTKPGEAQPLAASEAHSSLGKGTVNVKADDEQSEVFVDGSFVGTAPASLKLNEGNHVVEVKRNGFKDYRRALTVSAGAELNLRVALEKQ